MVFPKNAGPVTTKANEGCNGIDIEGSHTVTSSKNMDLHEGGFWRDTCCDLLFANCIIASDDFYSLNLVITIAMKKDA